MRRAWALALGLLAGLVLFVPLRWGVPQGVSAARVTGSIWSGRVEGLRLAGMALGDVEVALAPLPLLRGERRLRLRGADGRVMQLLVLPSGEIRMAQ